jgi:Putative stress-responsive transcriptional regulator
MILLIRLCAYIISGAIVWHFLQDATGPVALFPAGRRLALDPDNSMVFGVCAGIGKFTGLDVTLIRLGWTLTILYRGVGIALYILAFLLMPL